MGLLANKVAQDVRADSSRDGSVSSSRDGSIFGDEEGGSRSFKRRKHSDWSVRAGDPGNQVLGF